MSKVAALALILIQTAVFYGQETLRFLSEAEYDEAKSNNQWIVDSGNFPENFMESWEEDCKELMVINGLPVYVKSMSFEGKTGNDIYSATSNIIIRLQEISKQRLCLVRTIKNGFVVDETGWQWEIFKIHDISKNLVESYSVAIKCCFRDEHLKIAVWKMDEWSDENRCKEMASNLADMIEFALE